MRVAPFWVIVSLSLFSSIAGAQARCAWRGGLDGNHVVPPSGSQGYGGIFVDFAHDVDGCPSGQSTDSLLIQEFYYNDLEGLPIGAEIHRGIEGSNGELVQIITSGWFASGETFVVPLAPSYDTDLHDDLLYVIIRTDRHTEGELRGQLIGQPTIAQRTTWGRVRSICR
jgi:hypothetical protein